MDSRKSRINEEGVIKIRRDFKQIRWVFRLSAWSQRTCKLHACQCTETRDQRPARSNALRCCQDRMSVAGILCFEWIKFLIAVSHERAVAGIGFLNLLYQKMSCIFFFFCFVPLRQLWSFVTFVYFLFSSTPCSTVHISFLLFYFSVDLILLPLSPLLPPLQAISIVCIEYETAIFYNTVGRSISIDRMCMCVHVCVCFLFD